MSRVKKRGAYKARKWKRIFNAFNRQCLYCGKHLVIATESTQTHKNRCTADHVLPRHLGGNNSIWNIVPACAKCNSSKSDYYLWDFIPKKKLNIEDIRTRWINAAVILLETYLKRHYNISKLKQFNKEHVPIAEKELQIDDEYFCFVLITLRGLGDTNDNRTDA